MLAAIREIINPNVVIAHDMAKKELMLKEDGSDSKINKLYITNVPDEFVAFTLDHQPGGSDNRWFKQLSPYVDAGNNKGVNKGCDLIVLWQVNDRYIALIFDLKSNNPKPGATQKQLDNSELFLRYLLEMAKHHYQVDINNIEFKKAIVTTDEKGIRKGATYRPNNKPSIFGGYHIEQVVPKDRKTGYISFSQLVR